MCVFVLFVYVNFSDSSCRTSICLPSSAREIDEGEYATLRGTGTDDDLMHFNLISKRISMANCDTADDTSEEGKLLDCVRDDSVTYASTRDLEPPMPPPPPPLDDDDCETYADSSTETLVNPITVTVHTNETHVKCLLYSIQMTLFSLQYLVFLSLGTISNDTLMNITDHRTASHTSVESNSSC